MAGPPELYLPVDHGWAARTAFRDGHWHVAIPVHTLAHPMQSLPTEELLTITHLYGIPVTGDRVTDGRLHLTRRVEPDPDPDPQEDTMANRGLRDPDLPTWLTDLGPVTTQLLDAAQAALTTARAQLNSPETRQTAEALRQQLTTTIGELGKLFTVSDKHTTDSTAPERPLIHHGWEPGQHVVLVHRSSNQAHPGVVISTMDTEVRVQPDDGQHPWRLDFDPTTGDFADPYELRTPELHQQYLNVEAEAAFDPTPAPPAGPAVRDLTNTEFVDTLPPSPTGTYRWWTGKTYTVGKVHTLFVVNDEVRLAWVEDREGVISSVFLRAVTIIEPVL